MFPYLCPTSYVNRCQNYGWRYINQSLVFHQGLDYGSSYENIINTTDNTLIVEKATWHDEMGYYVRAQVNDSNIYFTYQHLDAFSVAEGEEINVGANIGISGNTGYSFGAHLHITTAESLSYDYIYGHTWRYFDPRIYFK